MPYKSKAQAAYMHAAAERGDMRPSVVSESDEASKGHMGNLPEHVKQMSHGGYACMSCGGAVGEHGYAEGGEFDFPEEEEAPADKMDPDSALILAISRRKHHGS